MGRFHDRVAGLPAPGRSVRVVARVAGVALLAVTVAVGLVGPPTDYRNLAILLVWVGWWGGYVASTYLLGDSWPTLNPFRTLAEAVDAGLSRVAGRRVAGRVDYPERWGSWPAVAGLLALVFLEVVWPLATRPDLLAAVVAGYAVVAVGGALAVGVDRWFGSVDPVAHAFRLYGRVAPLGRSEEGVSLRLPGAALPDAGVDGRRAGAADWSAAVVDGRDEVAFVVALLFVTTYDGFVGTGLWADYARALVGVGLPAPVVYLGTYLGGFALFYGTYRLAARAGRRAGDTYLTTDVLARRFAPSLLPIAAAYHLAHNLATMLALTPSLLVVAASPLSPPNNPPLLALGPIASAVGAVEIGLVLVGHVLAVWVAHATAYDLFPDRIQAVRSQYGVTAAMVLFTMTSLWIVSQSPRAPPFLPFV